MTGLAHARIRMALEIALYAAVVLIADWLLIGRPHP